MFSISNYFNTSNYYEQSLKLPCENSYQIMILKWADNATFVRETTKIGTLVGLVSSAASVFFAFDTTYLCVAAGCGIIWFAAGKCAQWLEPQAQAMIQHFKNIRDKKDFGSSAQIIVLQKNNLN